MTTKKAIFLTLGAAVFALGAFSRPKPAYADTCSGSETVCSSDPCTTACDPADKTKCFLICTMTKRSEE